MKLQQFFEDLQQGLLDGTLDGNMEVMVTSDAEGNSLNRYASFSKCFYNEEIDEDVWFDKEDMDACLEPEEVAQMKEVLILHVH